jgi:hypothetical protein
MLLALHLEAGLRIRVMDQNLTFIPFDLLIILLIEYNTPEVHHLVRRCHLGLSTLKMYFWVHELVEPFTIGP